MKTVRILSTNKIERVSNEKAHELVGNEFAGYVPKSVWKKEVRDLKQAEEKK